MGSKIGEILEPKEISLDALSGKIVAVDASITLYQFLSTIRQPDGTPLKDSSGRTTSHLSGLIYRTATLMEKGIKFVFVFDGKPTELKAKELKNRSERRAQAMRKWEEAKVLFPEEAFKYAQASSKVDKAIVEDAKTLLAYLGIPCLQAPSEGEAQAAYMAQKGDAEFVSSQDYDSLLFGAPAMIRNLTATRKKTKLEVIELKKLEEKHGITREQLVDIAILVGSDFNPGIKGIGVKTALKLIKKHHDIEKLMAQPEIGKKEGIEDYALVRDIFLHPDVNRSYELKWGNLDEGKVKEFLCEEHDFSEERVSKALEKISRSKHDVPQQKIGQWL